MTNDKCTVFSFQRRACGACQAEQFESVQDWGVALMRNEMAWSFGGG